MDVMISEEELSARRAIWVAPPLKVGCGDAVCKGQLPGRLTARKRAFSHVERAENARVEL